jgi:hypothetical protein
MPHLRRITDSAVPMEMTIWNTNENVAETGLWN